MRTAAGWKVGGMQRSPERSNSSSKWVVTVVLTRFSIEAVPLPISPRGEQKHFFSESERWVQSRDVSGRPARSARNAKTSWTNANSRRRGGGLACAQQGSKCPMANRTMKCKARSITTFSDVDICLKSAGGAVSKGMVAEDRRRGAVVNRQLVDMADGSDGR